MCDLATEFNCENRVCVLLTDVCNGKNDCGDNSDENLLTDECSKYSNNTIFWFFYFIAFFI